MSKCADKVAVNLLALDKFFHGIEVAAFELRQLLGFSTPMRAQHMVCSVIRIGLQMATCDVSIICLRHVQ